VDILFISNIVSLTEYNMNENKRIISKRPEKRKPSNIIISEVTGIPVNTVKAIRNGKRSKETNKGQKVEIAEMLIEEGTNKLIEEVKRVVKF
jgi:hypothetical protein